MAFLAAIFFALLATASVVAAATNAAASISWDFTPPPPPPAPKLDWEVGWGTTVGGGQLLSSWSATASPDLDLWSETSFWEGPTAAYSVTLTEVPFDRLFWAEGNLRATQTTLARTPTGQPFVGTSWYGQICPVGPTIRWIDTAAGKSMVVTNTSTQTLEVDFITMHKSVVVTLAVGESFTGQPDGWTVATIVRPDRAVCAQAFWREELSIKFFFPLVLR